MPWHWTRCLSHVASMAPSTRFGNRNPDAIYGIRPTTGRSRGASRRLVSLWSNLHGGNFNVKAGAQRIAAEVGLLLVAPDTSPRGDGGPRDPTGSYDFGLGAGFYVDATQPSWSRNYRMASCIERELPTLIVLSCPLISRMRALWATPWADLAFSQSPCATKIATRIAAAR
jgi:S-formylglutathione hydrolase FrmB